MAAKGKNKIMKREKNGIIELFETDLDIKTESFRLRATGALKQNLSLRQLVIECGAGGYSAGAHKGYPRERSSCKFAATFSKQAQKLSLIKVDRCQRL